MRRHAIAVHVLAALALPAALLIAAPPAQAAPFTVSPAAVGQNAETTVVIAGSGFSPSDQVSISGCPASNPQANYPVPFPSVDKPGSVQFVNSSTILLTTPGIIPSGVCDVTVGQQSMPDVLTFLPAAPRVTIEITNDSGVDDSDVWVTLGYACPAAYTSAFPPGATNCSNDGTVNPDFDWPAGPNGNDPNRYWYEAYAGAAPLKAFTGTPFTSLTPVPGSPQTRSFEVANIYSGVVYVSYGSAVNTGDDTAGRSPSYLTSTTRFDVFELTFAGATSADDTYAVQPYADITAVAGLGILMDMAGFDNSRDATGAKPVQVGSAITWQANLHDIYTALSDSGVDVDDTSVVVTSDGRPADGTNFLRFVSPSTNGGSGYQDLGAGSSSYLGWLAAQATPMTVVDQYNGAGIGSGTWFCYRTSAFSTSAPTTLSGSYGYASQALATAAAASGCSGGTPGSDITSATTPTSGTAGPITSQAVYMQDNRYLQGGQPAAGNDLYNAIWRDFIASTAYGYWGSLPGAAGWTTASWLNRTPPGTPAFSAAWPGLADDTLYPRWNTYAEAIWNASNAYGMPYSDTFANAGKGEPQISGANVFTLNVTLQPDGPWGEQASLAPATQSTTATVGTAFATQSLTATGFGAGLAYSVSPSLPSSEDSAVNGIWFDSATGVISGTPEAAAPLTTYTVTGRDTAGHEATATVALTIKAAVAPRITVTGSKVRTFTNAFGFRIDGRYRGLSAGAELTAYYRVRENGRFRTAPVLTVQTSPGSYTWKIRLKRPIFTAYIASGTTRSPRVTFATPT